jgi:exopolysaccharide biosynthesis polyprenyl glycosylphosphotransferase
MQIPSVAPTDSSRDRSLRAGILVLDAFIVVLSMAVSWGLHTKLRELPAISERLALRAPPSFEHYALLLYLTLPLFLALTAGFGMHRWFEHSRLSLLVGITKVHFAFVAALTFMFFVTQTVVNRSMLAFFLSSTFVLQLATRELLGHWQRFQHKSGQTRARLLLVGDHSPAMQKLIERSQRGPFPAEVVGRIGERVNQPHASFVGSAATQLSAIEAARGGLPDLARILHHEPVDRVLFFPPFNDVARIRESLSLCETLGIPAALAVDMTPSAVARPRIETHFGQPFVEFEIAPRPPGPLIVKHTVDVLAAALGLIVLSPLLLVTALSILITMGRPILFIQERAGVRGRSFRMFKFRTMVKNAEAQRAALNAENIMGGPVFKVKNDPRVTRLGRFLRSSSIDELPQLFNVLIGQMSLVGPRPLPRFEQEQIEGWHRRRLSMKPGITGLWQVSGRNEIGFEQWMKLDLEYVDNWSLREDVRLLLRTFPVLLHRRGAH